jgi:hypothetical protein
MTIAISWKRWLWGLAAVALLLFAGSCEPAWAQATIEVSTADLTGRPLAGRRVTLTPQFEQAVRDDVLVNVDAVAQITSTNGRAWFSNAVAGVYLIQIAGVPGTGYEITAPTNSGVFAATTLLTTNNSVVMGAGVQAVTQVRSSDGSVLISPASGIGSVDLTVVGGGGGGSTLAWSGASNGTNYHLVVTLVDGVPMVDLREGSGSGWDPLPWAGTSNGTNYRLVSRLVDGVVLVDLAVAN